MIDDNSTADETRRASRRLEATTLLKRTLAYARERDYTGPDYADGMSSRLLKALPFEHRYLNAAVQETVKRSPVNVRPLFLVPHRRNYKGAALFAMANLNAHELTGEEYYREEARALLDWLVDNRSQGYAGFCVGHAHDLQGWNKKWPAREPSVVSTSYAVKALLAGSHLDDRYGEMARSAADFLVEDLNYVVDDEGGRLDYKPTDDGEYYTLNANALGARTFADLYAAFGEEEYRERATEILDYVAAHQEDLGGWKYRVPSSASHLSMDNFHNGFIVESYDRYREVFDSDRYAETLESGTRFYRNVLFEENGAPNWDETESYPRDVHASAQGIFLFSRLGYADFADQVLNWTVNNLYGGDGRFYYRKGRFFTKRITLMRWCQAWMAYAVSEHLRTRREEPDSPGIAQSE